MVYEIHIFKSYPVSCLNRDDAGTPKTVFFGGAERARISSQCWKKMIRDSACFRNAVGLNKLGIRTRHLPELVFEELMARGYEEKDIAPWEKAIAGIAKKKKKNQDGSEAEKDAEKDDTKSAQLVFYSREDINAVADAIVSLMADIAAQPKVVTPVVEEPVVEEPAAEGGKGKKKKKKEEKLDPMSSAAILSKMKDAAIRPISPDIALMGRMVTCDAIRNVDSAMQVAHAISIHNVHQESDYITAMDDLLNGQTMETQGSAGIFDVDYNASCFYFYAAIDADAFTDNLAGVDAREQIVRTVVPEVMRAMCLNNPSGRQNSMCAHVMPSLVMVECKEDKIATNYVNFCVKPITASEDSDLVTNGINAFVEAVNDSDEAWGIPVAKRLWLNPDKKTVAVPNGATVCKNLNELLSEVQSTL